jgi:zinc transporter ZupT
MEWFEALSHPVQALIASLFTWAVTAAGAGMVFLIRQNKRILLDLMLGTAAGVMIAASFWSLLSPAIELSEQLYGNGWKMLLLLVPLYNIYLIFKLNIDLAHAFNKGTGFGIGLVLLPFVFSLMLAFGSAVYRDGSYEKIGKDVLSAGLDDIADKLSGEKPLYTKKEDIPQKLKDLDELRSSGIITDEEFKQKKEELLSRL